MSRGFVRINDDSKLGEIYDLAHSLRQVGFNIDAITEIVGQIVGTFEDQNLPAIKNVAIQFGASFTREEEEPTHTLKS